MKRYRHAFFLWLDELNYPQSQQHRSVYTKSVSFELPPRFVINAVKRSTITIQFSRRVRQQNQAN